MTRHVVIGTAGHIDHGKSALVHALTGTDTDRLAEEKRRGITIDLGFARMDLPDGSIASIVDVPGHEDFIRNMVAGASGIDVALVVVAADDGVMPQTREHLAILDVLDVRAAVFALTKCDLVEPEWIELATDDLRSHVAGTRFGDAPIVSVSARAGTGIDALRDALALAARAAASRAPADGLFRLPVDRSFVVHGTGTVVTGTVREGAVEVGAEVQVLPAGRTARVRALQNHGEDVERVDAGMRAAVALTGIERDAVGRGSWLVSPGWPLTSMLTARIELATDTTWELRQRQRVRVHLGTAEVMARVVLLDGPRADRARLGPGESGPAQLRLEAPVVARYGDRFVLRSYSPVTTIGGGRVLEPLPPKRRRLDDAARTLLDALDRSGAEALEGTVAAGGWAGLPVDELPLRLGLAASGIESAGVVEWSGRLYARALVDAAEAALLDVVDAWHRTHPLRPGMDRGEARRSTGIPEPGPSDAVIDGLVRSGCLKVVDGGIARADFVPRADDEQEAASARLLDVYAAAGLAPPRLDELPRDVAQRPDLRDLLARLEREGRLVPFPPDRLVHAEALAAARTILTEALGGRDGLAPGDFRAMFDLPRKHLIPLLEHFDRLGWTVRTGETRAVPGSSEAAGASKASGLSRGGAGADPGVSGASASPETPSRTPGRRQKGAKTR